MEKEIILDDIERTGQEKSEPRTEAGIMSAANDYGDKVAGEWDGDPNLRNEKAQEAIEEYLARPSVVAELKAIKDAKILALEEQETQDK